MGRIECGRGNGGDPALAHRPGSNRSLSGGACRAARSSSRRHIQSTFQHLLDNWPKYLFRRLTSQYNSFG